MIFASGLVLAAVAVTAANAGNPSYLRTTDKATNTNDDDSMFVARNPSGSEDFDPDDLTIDLTEIFGESNDGSHIKLNILDLIGSGSDQVDIDDLVEAFNDQTDNGDLFWLDENDGSQEHHHHHHHHHHHQEQEDDSAVDKHLKWVNDWTSTNAGSTDGVATKGGVGGAAITGDVDDDSSIDMLNSGSMGPIAPKAATKGGSAKDKDQGTDGDNLSWLIEDNGSFDSTATKGGAAFLYGNDPLASKGGAKGAGLYDDDFTSGSPDPMATKASKASKKGGAAGPDPVPLYNDDFTSGSPDPMATKASKASKKGGAAGPDPVPLYNDGSVSGIDGSTVDDDHHSYSFAGGAIKGPSPAVDDGDDNSKLDGNVSTQDGAAWTDSIDQVATKSTK